MTTALALHLLGRIIFGGYFLMNAYYHLFQTAALTGYAQAKGVPAPRTAVVVSGLLLLAGGLAFLSGWYLDWGRYALLLFLIPVTFKMHAFWQVSDPGQKMTEQSNFFKNLALIGALLMMF